MNMKKTLLLLSSLAFATVNQAALLVTYSLDSNFTVTTIHDLNIDSASDMTPASLTTVGFAGNNFGGYEFEGLPGTVSFDLTAASGFEISINQITMNVNNVQNQSTSFTIDVNSSEVASGGGNVQAYDSGVFTATPAATTKNVVINWSGASWPDQEMQDVQIFGTVSAIPEPSTLALLGLTGVAGVIGLHRRKRA
jgi:hypothetical protein